MIKLTSCDKNAGTIFSKMYYIKKQTKFKLDVWKFLLNYMSLHILSAKPTLLLCLKHNIELHSKNR